MKCPTCKRPTEEGGPFDPFCSERCKLIDLGNWASEKYVVPGPIEPEPDSESAEQDRADDDRP